MNQQQKNPFVQTINNISTFRGEKEGANHSLSPQQKQYLLAKDLCTPKNSNKRSESHHMFKEKATFTPQSIKSQQYFDQVHYPVIGKPNSNIKKTEEHLGLVSPKRFTSSQQVQQKGEKTPKFFQGKQNSKVNLLASSQQFSISSFSQFPNQQNQFGTPSSLSNLKVNSQATDMFHTSPNISRNQTFRSFQQTPRSNKGSHIQFSYNLESYQSINENFSKQINWIDKIESKNFISSQSTGHLTTPISFKKTSISSHNLIVSNKSIESTLISPNVPIVFRCDINDFIYFKIKVFEQDSPLKLKFTSENNPSNMKFFVSKSCLQPNNFNCDYFFNNQKIVVIEEERNLARFRKQGCYYFSIVSELGQDITLRASFGQDKKLSEAKSQLKKIKAQTKPSEEQIRTKSQATLQNEEPENDAKHTDICNLVQKNILASASIDQFSRSLSVLNRRQGNYEKMQLVVKKGQQIFESKVEEILKYEEDKERKLILKINQFRRNFFVFFWNQIINVVLITNTINQRYSEKKESLIYFSKIAWRAIPLTKKFRKYRSKYPENIDENTIRYGRYAMASLARIIKKTRKEKAREVMALALRHNQYYSDVKAKMIRCYKIVVSVQTKFRQFRNKIINFKKLLMKLWDKYFFVLVEQIIDLKKKEDNESLHWKKKQAILIQINCLKAKKDAVDKYFLEILRLYNDNLIEYVYFTRTLTVDQKRIINVVEAFMNTKHKKRHNDIFKKFLEEKSQNFNVDNVALSQTTPVTQPKDSAYQVLPRLFVMPSLQQMHGLIKQGIVDFVNSSQEIFEKVNIKL